jgi:hypothetical protein
MTDIWYWEATVYGTPEDADSGRDLTDYEVEATDGGIGKIDEATADAGRGHIVVDTGWWIFGKKRLLPAGVITRVDDEERKVYLTCSKDAVRDAPDFDPDLASQPDFRESVGTHFRR